MKNFLLLAIVTFITFSFTVIEGGKKTIDTTKSSLVWKGYKVTGSHVGTLDITSGSLSFEEEKLVGGEFLVDMTSLTSTDLTGEYKGKLEGHLKSDDFFGVAAHPTAHLVFKSATPSGKNSYAVKADVTIKGITKTVDFECSIYGNKATAAIKIDRTDFNVQYGSASFFEGLADKAIYDEFDLVIDVVFK